MPRLCEFYTGICLTTEEKARKNLSQGKKNLDQFVQCARMFYLLVKQSPRSQSTEFLHT